MRVSGPKLKAQTFPFFRYVPGKANCGKTETVIKVLEVAVSLGTDGYGRSDTRMNLRRFFEIDAECIVIAVLNALFQRGEIELEVVQQAIRDLEIDPEKAAPEIL